MSQQDDVGEDTDFANAMATPKPINPYFIEEVAAALKETPPKPVNPQAQNKLVRKRAKKVKKVKKAMTTKASFKKRW